MKDPWAHLKLLTQARIGLGHCGHSLPTKAQLEFQIAHARARDAIHIPWDLGFFGKKLENQVGLQVLELESQVQDRMQYLQRPDLGRRLDLSSTKKINDFQSIKNQNKNPIDIAVIFTNGLSTLAIDNHGVMLAEKIIRKLQAQNFRLSPICLVANGRVAIADEVGQLFKAQLSLIIVGERPGLSVPDSLGLYLTYFPRIGKTDAERNCISNIREPDGLTYEESSEKTLYLCEMALSKRLSGVYLKDEMILPVKKID